MNFEEHDVEWTGEKISRFWNYYQHSLASSDHYFGAHQGSHVAHFIDRNIRFSKLQKILDFSCGIGGIIAACLPYLNNGQQIFGSDFSRSSVDFVNERFKGSTRFMGAALLTSLPSQFADGEFDLIISTEVVEHLTDSELDAMLKESYRILSPNGYLFITTPNEENRDLNSTMCPDCGCKFHRWQHLRSWSATSLRETIEMYGFRTKVVKPIAWGDTAFKRFAYKVAAKFNMKVQGGLVYVGQKKPSL